MSARVQTMPRAMATHSDADIILRLYDLRREAVMRKAREWFIGWFPGAPEEARSACSGAGRQDNAYVRQVSTFWEMAFSLANSGAVDADLFAKNCGEGLLLCAKCQWLKGKFPDAWTRGMPEAEAFIAGNAIAQKKSEMMKARFADK